MTLKQMSVFVVANLSFLAFAGPDWNGRTDNSWWTVSNWETGSWPKDEQDQPIVPAEVPSSMVEPYFGWQIDDRSATTINLGGRDRPITATGNFDVCKDGYEITFTNGSISVNGWLKVSTDKQTENVVMRLKDVDLTCSVIQIGEFWTAPGCGTFIVDSGTVSATDMRMVPDETETSTFVMNGGETRLHWLSCSSKGGGDGRIELNGGTLKVPDFSYVNWEGPLAQENGSTNINMTLVFNGGTLKAWPNNYDTVYGYNFVPVWMRTVIGEGGVIIDSNGYDVTFGATNITAVANDGGLTKTGAGTLKVDKGVVWSGTTKVLGGTLDLNGGTVTGPLVFGGDGRIVNATIQTTDIKIQGGYVLSPYDFANVSDEGVVQMTTLVVGEGSSSVAPVAGLIASAAGWYDPSDSNTITTDENGGVTKIANKGAAGTSLDAEMCNDSGYITWQGHAGLELAYVGKLNGLDALVFTNNITGFETPSHQFSDGSGKAVFAVSMRSDALVPADAIESVGCVYPAEWCRGGFVWDTDNFLGVASMDGWHHLRYKLDDEYGSLKDVDWGDTSVTDWPERQMFDQMIYVSSIRATDRRAEGKSSVYSRADRYDNGTLKVANGASEAVALQQSENMESRICIGWSKAMKWHDSEVGNIPSVTAGYVGEILAFDRTVSDFESEIIHAYLEHKWISSDLPAPQAKLSIGTLTLDGGTVGFEGSDVTIGNIVGAGAISDVAKATVTGTITAKLAAEGASVSVGAPLDLTGTTLVIDESRFVLAEYGQTATVLAAAGITGTPTLQLAEGDRRKIKVRNTGTAIVVERVNPGMVVTIR